MKLRSSSRQGRNGSGHVRAGVVFGQAPHAVQADDRDGDVVVRELLGNVQQVLEGGVIDQADVAVEVEEHRLGFRRHLVQLLAELHGVEADQRLVQVQVEVSVPQLAAADRIAEEVEQA